MKKILNGPTVWRAKCTYCDCEFEYDYGEVEIYSVNSDLEKGFIKGVNCPNCNMISEHRLNVKTTTELKKEDTMTT